MRVKKYSVIGILLLIGVVVVIACMAKKPAHQDIETTPATIAATEAKEDARDLPESKGEKEIMTYGIYQSSETNEDVDGEYTQAMFVDDYGMEFVANISENTDVPDKLEEGKTYMVIHSEMMTMSIPGIYPEVYKIEKSETEIHPDGIADDSDEDRTEVTDEYNVSEEPVDDTQEPS